MKALVSRALRALDRRNPEGPWTLDTGAPAAKLLRWAEGRASLRDAWLERSSSWNPDDAYGIEEDY